MREREREREREQEKERERIPGRHQSLTQGLNSRTVRSWPEPKWRVGRWINWATQVLLDGLLNSGASTAVSLNPFSSYLFPWDYLLQCNDFCYQQIFFSNLLPESKGFFIYSYGTYLTGLQFFFLIPICPKQSSSYSQRLKSVLLFLFSASLIVIINCTGLRANTLVTALLPGILASM